MPRGWPRPPVPCRPRSRRGERTAAARFAEHAQAYGELLDRHIDKEDNVLFVLAERYLTDEKLNELAWGFERIENEEITTGRHDAFHLMLDRLADHYLNQAVARKPRGNSCRSGFLCSNLVQ